MPNKARIKLWVDALRSGKWVYVRGQLHCGDAKRCALGVAIEVWLEHVAPPVDDPFNGTNLPVACARWFGLRSDPIIGDLTITELNDSYSYTFIGLADMIERHYLTGAVPA